MAWIVFVVICFQEALCQYNPDDSRAKPYDLYDMEDKITKAGKWPEFIAKIKETGDKVQGNVMPNWEEDVYKWAAWVKNLDNPTRRAPVPQRPPLVRYEEQAEKPTLGMEMYWGENENEKAPAQPQRNGPEYNSNSQAGYQGPGQSYRQPGASGYAPPPSNGIPKQISANNIMNMAQKRIEFLEKQQQYGAPNLEGVPTGSENPSERDFIKFAFSKLHQLENLLRARQTAINGTNSTKKANDDPLSKLPKVDDFDSPIRWVPFNSDDIADGIAKITDKESGKNKQYTINGTIYVPVVDYDLTRLGLTTEPTTISSAILAMYRQSTEANVLRTIMDNVDMKHPDQRDWLAFETILGGDRNEKMCSGSHCQARCRSLGCETMCDGDTCGAGCVGPACNSMCKGEGCSSMCIGEGCVARCEGLSCDARCRGKNCEAVCRKLSCFFTINGKSEASRSSWNDYYPQQGPSPDGNYD